MAYVSPLVSHEGQQEAILVNPESILLSTFTPDGREDPYPALAELRKIAPVHYGQELDSYFLTRFSDCHAALRNPLLRTPDLEWFHREVAAGREHPAAEFFYSSMLRANSPLHDPMRRMVGAEFSARHMAVLGPTVEKITHEVLDGFADATSGGGTANFQDLVGYPLRVAVVGALIGVPRDEQERFYRYGRDAGRIPEPVRSPDDWKRADLAVETLREYFTELLRRRRAHPADGLASTLLAMRESADEPLGERQSTDILLLVFVAGFEKSRSRTPPGTRRVQGAAKGHQGPQLQRDRASASARRRPVWKARPWYGRSCRASRTWRRPAPRCAATR
ncbi:hypothetical protein [Streptomyces sp. NPDC088258]|uniref:hypothetical protein n=1 Tax=Streptomyces sp. NPDC088258 TaxID=3365849 RepID=UPI003818BC88